MTDTFYRCNITTSLEIQRFNVLTLYFSCNREWFILFQRERLIASAGL